MDRPSCSVFPDGDRVLVALRDKEGKSQELTLSYDEVRALAVTLPCLLALDPRSRQAEELPPYGVRAFAVECAPDERHVLLKLSCEGAGEASFGFDVDMIPSLAHALVGSQALVEAPPPLRLN